MDVKEISIHNPHPDDLGKVLYLSDNVFSHGSIAYFFVESDQAMVRLKSGLAAHSVYLNPPKLEKRVESGVLWKVQS